MQYRITIDTENDAFYPTPCEEIARILEKLAAQIREHGQMQSESFRLYDYNGNRVGAAEFTQESK